MLRKIYGPIVDATKGIYRIRTTRKPDDLYGAKVSIGKRPTPPMET